FGRVNSIEVTARHAAACVLLGTVQQAREAFVEMSLRAKTLLGGENGPVSLSWGQDDADCKDENEIIVEDGDQDEDVIADESDGRGAPEYDFLLEREKVELRGMLSTGGLDNTSVLRGMKFCLKMADSARECAALLVESLRYENMTDARVAIGRLYIMSDVLFNANSVVRNAAKYRDFIQGDLPQIFADLGRLRRETTTGRLTSSEMDGRVKRVLEAWREKMLFSLRFLIGLEIMYNVADSELVAWTRDPSLAEDDAALSLEDLNRPFQSQARRTIAGRLPVVDGRRAARLE
ncbi:Protein RRC1 (Reduced red-light responses in cry1cry2 background 1), partial [Durusdinium trenchii]